LEAGSELPVKTAAKRDKKGFWKKSICVEGTKMKIGEKIADAEFEAYQNDEIKKMKFSDFKGKWLVLLFYPADFTFVCPTELEEAANYYDEFKKNKAEIMSISTDTVYVHKAWHDQSPAIKKIRFPMVADPAAKISREFGVYIEEEGQTWRATFIIDPEGTVKAMDVHDNSIGRNAKEILRKLQAAAFVREHKGLVCPASWEPGKETLKPGLDLVGKI
jgi:peroxiredoxin (alkyl hydroperoxide reductase subunit C)